ncbi:MAG: FtsX-like permease family protein [Planctomycetota bacterium]
MSLSANLLLTRTHLAARPGRVLAVGVALGFAGCLLLISLLSLRRTERDTNQMPYDLLPADQLYLAATDPVYPFIPTALLESVTNDPRVNRVEQAIRVAVFDLPGDEQGELDREQFYSGPQSGWIPGKRYELVALKGDVKQGKLLDGRWPDEETTDVIELVVPQHLMWSMKLGDRRRLESDAGVFPGKVVGFLRNSAAFIGTDESLRLTPWRISEAAAARISGGERPPSDLRIFLNDATEESSFVEDWRIQLAGHAGRLELWDQKLIRSRAQDSSTSNIARSSAVTLVLLVGACAICIAFSVQGNIARERVRQYALLRSMGASRTVVAGGVLIESCVLAIIGLCFAVALAWLVLSAVPVIGIPPSFDFASLFYAGVVLLSGAIIGATQPAIIASRIQPARDDPGHPRIERRVMLLRAVAAIAVVAFTAACIWLTPSGSPSRAFALTWCGVPSLAVAVILITPILVRLVSMFFTRPVAWLTRTNSALLSDQLSIDRSASTGSVLAMSIGLSGFIWIICWGASMLEPFIIDSRFPRWMVSVYPYGLEEDESDVLMNQPGFAKMEPLVLVDTRLAETDFQSKSVDSFVSTLVMGMRPAYAKEHLPIEVLRGEASRVFDKLSEGHCLISSWFANSAGLQVGDNVPIMVPGRGKQREYEVAGVIKLRGWLMSTKQNKVRLRGKPHELMVIVDIDRVREDFDTSYANYFLGDTGTESSEKILPYPDGTSLRRGTMISRAGREAMANVVDRVVDLDRPIRHSPDGIEISLTQRSVQADDLDRVRAALRGEWGGAIVQRLGWVPLLFLAASLFSVVGSLVASLRSRGRELGILRSCGLSRFGLIRLVFAESLLQGLSAIMVACLFGFGGAWIMLRVAQIAGLYWRWAGIGAEFLVPWSWLWPGWILTFLVCGLASVFAGWRIGRQMPAQLFRERIGTA